MMVTFHFEKKISLRDRRALKDFIELIFRKEKIEADLINYIFCSDRYLLNINNQFLKHNYYTDIITFDLSDSGKPKQGEIYISTDRVKDNAKIHKVSMTKELHRVIFHGILHLCGYKDKTAKDSKIIRSKEDFYLSLYGF